MEFWVIYCLKVVVIQALCLMFYHYVLSGLKFHRLNRFFLLTSLLSSFFIPFIEIPEPLQSAEWAIQEVVTITRISDGVENLIPVVTQDVGLFNVWMLARILYFLVCGWLLLRFALFLHFIFRLKNQSEYVSKSWFRLYRTRQVQAFSFFKAVFMPSAMFETHAYEQILSHECVHVRQHHSLDRLLVDLLVSLFWFNPFIYWYRNALIEIHEFQADNAVINQFQDPVGYQEILFGQLQSGYQSGLVSHFNFSVIKKRIVMINKQNKKHTLWRYILVLPLFATVIFAFTSRAAVEPLETMGNSLFQALGPDPGVDFENQWVEVKQMIQGDEVPSILPIKEADRVRKSSGFGMRMDPITKEKKLHKGLDFAAPKGTSVIASADGVVQTVDFIKDGYGHHIIISHGKTYQSLYAQLSQTIVAVGDRVKKGQKIGEIGSSGRSTAPHLHYEVIKLNEGNVNPEDYIKDYKISHLQNQQKLGSDIPSMPPLNLSADNAPLVSGFGMRKDPVLNVEKRHTGVDFNVEIGAEVMATADGRVDFVGNQETGYGKYIVIKHGDEFETWYAHLSEMMVKQGDEVKAGQVIGKSGNTGKSNVPHLHYAIKKSGEFVDPLPYMGDFEVSVYESRILSDEEVERITQLAHEEMQKAMAMIDEQKIALEVHRQMMEQHREQMELARVIMDSINVEELQQLAIEKQELAMELQKITIDKERIMEEVAREMEQLAKEMEELRQKEEKKMKKNK